MVPRPSQCGRCRSGSTMLPAMAMTASLTRQTAPPPRHQRVPRIAFTLLANVASIKVAMQVYTTPDCLGAIRWIGRDPNSRDKRFGLELDEPRSFSEFQNGGGLFDCRPGHGVLAGASELSQLPPPPGELSFEDLLRQELSLPVPPKASSTPVASSNVRPYRNPALRPQQALPPSERFPKPDRNSSPAHLLPLNFDPRDPVYSSAVCKCRRLRLI